MPEGNSSFLWVVTGISIRESIQIKLQEAIDSS